MNHLTTFEKDRIMGDGSAKAREISLGNDFGDVAVKANGGRVEIHSDGGVVAYTKSDVDAYTNGAVHVHPAVNDDIAIFPPVASGDVSQLLPATKAEPKPGDRMADGTVYAGISADTNKPMYTTPADAPLTNTFNQAQKYAAKLDAHGRQDWRVPTKGELNVLYNNRAAIGGFNETGSHPAGWYWSSRQNDDFIAWDQRFSDGNQYYYYKTLESSLRCVR